MCARILLTNSSLKEISLCGNSVLRHETVPSTHSLPSLPSLLFLSLPSFPLLPSCLVPYAAAVFTKSWGNSLLLHLPFPLCSSPSPPPPPPGTVSTHTDTRMPPPASVIRNYRRVMNPQTFSYFFRVQEGTPQPVTWWWLGRGGKTVYLLVVWRAVRVGGLRVWLWLGR